MNYISIRLKDKDNNTEKNLKSMDNKSRIVLNSLYIYIGVIACTVISLLTVPILLRNLGTSDYGLYNLVAGIIAMLAFLKSSMIVTVQRYMNVAYGANDLHLVNKIFTVSLLLYIIAALITVLLIEMLGPLISNGYLNIDHERIPAATTLFQVLVISTFFTTISIPYDALFNVYEEMWIFSFFHTMESVLRLALAFGITYIDNGDKLVAYAYGMVIIAVLTFLLKVLCCKKRYRSIHFTTFIKEDLSIAKRLFSFIGWNLYGTLARIFSTQGFAIVLNLFSGTSINAAYGIANQVNASLQHFTSSVEKAFNPQIMKSEGMNDRGRVVKISLLQTKYCSIIYAAFAIPLLSAIPFILEVWLTTPPEHTVAFARIVIFASLLSVSCSGISSIFYATGNIQRYIVWLGTLMIANVFVAYGIMRLGASVEVVVGLFIILELFLMILRLYYANKYDYFNFNDYWSIVLKPLIVISAPTFMVAFIIPSNNFVTTTIMILMTEIVFFSLLYKKGLKTDEREILKSKIKKIIKR